MSTYLQQLIRQGENQELDFKFGITDSKKIARTLAAFSNTGGGRLLIGVKDNGNISGVRSEEEYYMLEAAASMYCRPEVSFRVRKWEVNGKTVLEAIIPGVARKPVLAPDEHGTWRAFVRVGDQNLVAGRVLVKVWQKEKRRRGMNIPYTRSERLLLEYLGKHGAVTLPGFYRMATISREHAENILANLIVLGVLRMEIQEKQTLYRLNKPVDKAPGKTRQ